MKAEQDDLAAKLREQQAELDRQKAEIEAAKPKPDDTPIYRGGPRFAPPSELGEAIGTLLQAQDAERRGQSEAEGWTQKTIRQAIESAFAAEPPVDSLAIGFGDPGPTSAAANGYYDEPPASVDPVIPAKLWMFWLGSLAGGWVVAFDESAPDTLIVSYDETKNEGIAAYYAEYFGMPCRPVRVK